MKKVLNYIKSNIFLLILILIFILPFFFNIIESVSNTSIKGQNCGTIIGNDPQSQSYKDGVSCFLKAYNDGQEATLEKVYNLPNSSKTRVFYYTHKLTNEDKNATKTLSDKAAYISSYSASPYSLLGQSPSKQDCMIVHDNEHNYDLSRCDTDSTVDNFSKQ